MKRSHWIAISITVILFATLTWGVDRVPVEVQEAEKTRVMGFQTVNPVSLENDAIPRLTNDQKEYYYSLKTAIENSNTDSLQVDLLKRMSSFWFQNEERLIAGAYAKKAAQKEDLPESWGIAGTTFILCTQGEKEDKKEYCREQAIQCFDNAISLAPEIIDHQINKALVYVEMPPEENPMMGIQQLLTLQREYPDNVPVLIQLARLGMRTGQWEKARGRLEKALELEPNNLSANCMMVEAMKNTSSSSEEIKRQEEMCSTLKK